jgi:hypothetical protein
MMTAVVLSPLAGTLTGFLALRLPRYLTGRGGAAV